MAGVTGRPFRQPSKQALGPGFASQTQARWWLPNECQRFTALCVPQPIHPLNMPPSVLPAVVTKMAGQKRPKLSSAQPKTAGSDPMGSKGADTKDTTNTAPSRLKSMQLSNDLFSTRSFHLLKY